jgi:tripartite-type tricarboxylate transporter receptor subunit TctC
MSNRRIKGFALPLAAAIAFAASGFVVTSASAQNWPERAVKIVVPHSPGGAPDVMAR